MVVAIWGTYFIVCTPPTEGRREEINWSGLNCLEQPVFVSPKYYCSVVTGVPKNKIISSTQDDRCNWKGRKRRQKSRISDRDKSVPYSNSRVLRAQKTAPLRISLSSYIRDESFVNFSFAWSFWCKPSWVSAAFFPIIHTAHTALESRSTCGGTDGRRSVSPSRQAS